MTVDEVEVGGMEAGQGTGNGLLDPGCRIVEFGGRDAAHFCDEEDIRSREGGIGFFERGGECLA